MSRTLLIAAMALLVAWSTDASANLIVNGGFEAGTFPWSLSGDVVIDNSQPNTGTFNAAFFFSNGVLEQSVSTAGTNFTLSFALNNGSTDPLGQSTFAVYFDGNQVVSFSTLDNFGQGYFTTTLPVSTLDSVTLLSFIGSNDLGDWYLDDVSLVPVVANVPEPPSILILGGALALFLSLSFTVAPRLRVARNGLPKSDLV